MSTISTAEPQSSAIAPSRRLARVALLAMFSIYFFSFFHRTAVPGTLFDELQHEWNLSASALAGLGSVFLWTYGTMQLVSGVAIDRFGGVRTLLFGSVLMSIGAVLFPLSTTPGMLYVSRAITAVGDSCVFLSIAKEISLLFDHRRFPVLIGILQAVGPCGGMFAMLPLERAAHAFGWRPALLTMAIATAVTVAINFFILPRLKHFVPARTGFSLQPLKEIIRHRPNWPMFLSGFINFPVYFAIQILIGKKFLGDFAHLKSKPAATFTLIMMGVSGAVSLASGIILQHTGGKRKPFMLAGVFILITSTLLLAGGIWFHASPSFFLFAYILLAVSNISNPIGTTIIRELNDHRHVAQALALVNAIVYCGVAVIMMLSGSVLDLFHADTIKTETGIIYPAAAYMTLFLSLAVLAVVSLISTAYLRETHIPVPHPSDLSETSEAF